MKLFISHAGRDADIVRKFVDLLLKIGMREEDMFCSSVEGIDIPIQQNIYDYLRNLLNSEKIHVVFMLSDNYYQSPACLNEMGAAWVKRTDYTTFLLPGFEYKDIEGAVDPRGMSIKLDDDELKVKNRLGQFKNQLMQNFGFSVSDIRWEQCRDEFLVSIQPNETSFDLTESETFCINDTHKDGCRIGNRNEKEITVDIDFAKTSSGLCSLVTYPPEEDWTKWIKQGKSLEFEIHASPSIKKLELELQIPSAGRNIQQNIENLNGFNCKPLQDICPRAEKRSQVTQVNFLIHQEDVENSGYFTVKNIRIR